ncbi:MAG: coproporphyrinogen-III oxidase family protein [Spirochaetota bacterium]
MSLPAALYVHVPFCTAKCGYCAFHSITGWTPGATRVMTSAIVADMDELAGLLPSVRTLYVGGGTPTTLEPASLLSLISRPRDLGAPVAEITVEANPESTTPELTAVLEEAGVDRLSVGVQTLEPAAARVLGRRLSSLTEIEAIRRAWHGALSLDLIHGAPGSTRDGFLRNLRALLALGVDHLSVYGLSIEPDTPLERAVSARTVRPPQADDEWPDVVATIEAAGLRRYEVSNFALPGSECRHNQAYWRGERFLGLGPSAVSTLDAPGAATPPSMVPAIRVTQPCDHAAYLARSGPLSGEIEPLDERDLIAERIMLGLRTSEGIRADGALATVREPLLQRARMLEAAGLVVTAEDTIRPTHRGMDLLNRVLVALLDVL